MKKPPRRVCVNMLKTGFCEPVFFMGGYENTRLYLDVPQGARAVLHYSYDAPWYVRRGVGVLWQRHAAGVLEGDFAESFHIPPVAVRVQVLALQEGQKVQLILDEN